MNYTDFIGSIQSRVGLESPGEAVRAAQATLEVLGQRLPGAAAERLASQLPAELRPLLFPGRAGQRFGLAEFFERVSQQSGQDLPEAIFQARAVAAALCAALSPDDLDRVRAALSADYEPLFECGLAGSPIDASRL